jgi:hypothetical protein
MKRHETELVPIEFNDAALGAAELTWGQDLMCRWRENSAPYTEHMSLDVLIECEAGTRTTLDDVRDALQGAPVGEPHGT